MHCTESSCVIGLDNILLAGASIHLSAQNFTGWGSEGVNVALVFLLVSVC